MALQNLAGQSSQIQGLTRNLLGDYGTRAQETADLLSDQAIRDVSSKFADMNAINSSAALSAMTRGAAVPQAEMLQNLAGLESQIGTGLANQYLGGLSQGYQTQAGLLGLNLGLQGQMAAPEYYSPSYHYQEGRKGFFGK